MIAMVHWSMCDINVRTKDRLQEKIPLIVRTLNFESKNISKLWQMCYGLL